MRQFFIVLIGLLCFVEMQAQIGSTGNNGNSIPDDDWICHLEQEGQFSPEMNFDSRNGRVITPKGDLVVLVVYVDFEGSEEREGVVDSLVLNWPAGNLPTHVNLSNGNLGFGHQRGDSFSSLSNPPADIQYNLSEFYHHMSNGEFKVYFETVKNSAGQPQLITIDPLGASTYGEINRRAIVKIKQDYPNIDWSDFDIRPDRPNNNNDASATFANTNPNGELDYVIFLHRNDWSWSPHPTGNSGGYYPSGASGIAFALHNNTPELIGSSQIESYYVTKFGGHTMLRDVGYSPLRLQTNLHELAHNIQIGFTHYGTANNSYGSFFYSSYFENTQKYGQISSVANPWERWYAGWMEITHDLSGSQDSGTYVISEYLDTDETMRLKIPSVQNEYVCLSYRDVNSNDFYKRTYNGGSLSNFNTPNSGLYAEIEKMSYDRLDGSDLPSSNGMKAMDGSKYYDFSYDDLWGSAGVKVNIFEENPFSAHAISVPFKYDYNDNTQILRNEGKFIAEISNNKVLGQNTNNRSLPDGKYSSFSNPPINNFQFFNPAQTLSPIVLHSLSFSSKTIGNTVQITVDYDDGHIEEDFRMTGNILLPSNEDIYLDKEVILSINRSGTPNMQNDLLNVSDPVIDQFISPTVFKANENSSFSIGKGGTIIIDEGSTVIFEENSQLNFEQGGKIIVRGGSLLCIKTDDVNFANFTSRIVVEDGYLNVASGIDISSNITFADNNFAFPTIAPVINYCGNTQSNLHLHSSQETNVGDPVCPFDVFIGVDKFVKLTSQDHIDIGPGFEVDGGYFDGHIQYIIPQDCDIEFYYGGDPEPSGFWDGPSDGSIDKSIKEGMAVKVFPNPSRDVFNVSIENERGSFSYSIRDFKGLEVDARNVGNNSFNFDLSSQPRGIYFLTVQLGDKIETVELIKL